MDVSKQNSDIDLDGASRAASRRTQPHPLENVVATPRSGSVFEMQTGLFHLGRNRSLHSGTAEPMADDVRALQNHARAMARDTYRDLYDPARNAHDAMHQTEYEKAFKQRDEAEKAEQHAAANLRDAEIRLAASPKAGPKPSAQPALVTAFIVAITVTVAPTLHDSMFHTLPDDMLVWFLSLLSASFVAGMLTLAILTGRRTRWAWIGVAAGVILGVGMGAVRLSSAENKGEDIFALGLMAMEIAAVLLLEGLASGLHLAETEWSPRHDTEQQAFAARDAAEAELGRRRARIRELNETVSIKVAFVEDRHNRHIHIAELEDVAIKAVLDGYNAGITENIGRVRGVVRRTE